MNGSKIFLDTNIILYLLSGDTTIANFLEGKEGYLSVITELELLGYRNITEEELDQIKKFLEDCIVVDINVEVKNIYLALRKKYHLKLGDAVIAATAMYMDLPLVTADKQFNQIAELNITLYNP